MKSILASKEKNTILIVDDSIENLKLLSGLLEDDYILCVAKNGEKALSILESNPEIDLVLLDIVLPFGIDGIEVCRRIKSNDSLQHIPVIFLTGLSDSEDEAIGLLIGGADYITKPFQPQVIRARIYTHLKLKEEKEKSKKLLEILLPKNVIKDFMKKGEYTPVIHDSVSILFCDLVGFTEASTKLSANLLVSELSILFTEFDVIMERNSCIRIKTLGDGYMAVSGINNEKNHANSLVNAGLQLIDYLKNRKSGYDWKCRIGINSGEAISGIVGNYRFQFDLMGDNVNIASRVESNAPVMGLAATFDTVNLLEKEKYKIFSMGRRSLKGKGEIELFTIEKKQD